MAQTSAERMTALERIVDVHLARFDAVTKRVDAVHDKHSEAAKDFNTLHRDFDREIALLKREVEVLDKKHEELKRS